MSLARVAVGRAGLAEASGRAVGTGDDVAATRPAPEGGGKIILARVPFFRAEAEFSVLALLASGRYLDRFLPTFHKHPIAWAALALALLVFLPLVLVVVRDPPLTEEDVAQMRAVLGIYCPASVLRMSTYVCYETEYNPDLYVRIQCSASDIAQLVSQPIFRDLKKVPRELWIGESVPGWGGGHAEDILLRLDAAGHKQIMIRKTGDKAEVFVALQNFQRERIPTGLWNALLRYPDNNWALGPAPLTASREWP